MDEQNRIPGSSSSGEYQVDEILQQLAAEEKPAEPALGPESQTAMVAPPEKENAPVKTKKNAKKKSRKKSAGRSCLTTFLWLFCIGVVSVAVAAGGLLAASDYIGLGKDFIRGRETENVQIFVDEGATIREIAQQLEERDVLISRHVFLAYLKLTGKGSNMNYGAHDFTTKMGYDEILESLAQPAKAEDVTVTIPSGKSVETILHILEDAGVCKYADLRNELLNGSFDSPLVEAIPQHPAMYYSLEGYLFPDTYDFYLNDDPHRVIQKMLDNLEEKFTPEMRKIAADNGYTTHEIMTMASIVEMESCGYFEEMPKVSAVFYNRLKDWPAGARFLQSDPTMEYPYGNGAYNTYKTEGVPPGPMCNVTEAAIKASVSPDKTVDAYYFVTDSQFRFYYNKTLSAHDATINDLKRQGLWLSSAAQ